MIGYGAEGRWFESPIGQPVTYNFFVNPAVNAYLFRIREDLKQRIWLGSAFHLL